MPERKAWWSGPHHRVGDQRGQSGGTRGPEARRPFCGEAAPVRSWSPGVHWETAPRPRSSSARRAPPHSYFLLKTRISATGPKGPRGSSPTFRAGGPASQLRTEGVRSFLLFPCFLCQMRRKAASLEWILKLPTSLHSTLLFRLGRCLKTKNFHRKKKKV